MELATTVISDGRQSDAPLSGMGYSYLDEFTLRFYRRRTPMAAFQPLLALTGAHEPPTYKVPYGSESTG